MVTDDELRRIMPTLKADRRALMLPFIQQAMAEFGITTYLREAAFLAQLGHESLDLKFMEEIASGAQYEGRRDLGNTQPGDGKRFKGRGPIQLTGRANYKRYGDLLGLDLINNPTQAATPEVGFRIAGLFWKSNGLNELADAQQFKTISIRINGRNKKTGLPNGWDDRLRRYGIAKQVLSQGDAAAPAPVAPPPPTVAPPPPTVADESATPSALADASGGATGAPSSTPTEVASSGVNALTNLFSNIANEAAGVAGTLFRSGTRGMSGGTSNIPKNLSRGIYPANEENAGAKKSAAKKPAAKKSAKKAATGKGAAKKSAAGKGAGKKASARKSAKKGAAKASGKAGAKGGSKKGGAKAAAKKSSKKGGANKGTAKKGGGSSKKGAGKKGAAKKGGAKKGGGKKGGSRGMQNLPV